jgi:low temperature requirement protein LtrA
MTEHAQSPQPRKWIVPMLPRSKDETHRASTPLELFFDLVFVVAIAQAGAALHHGFAEGHITESIISYIAVFFAIWWAWLNFTWFASAYDCDDVPYRLATFIQITGALIIAAGVPQAFEHADYSLAVVGYVVMRLALVSQYIRARRNTPTRQVTGMRYIVGTIACQIGWAGLVFFQGQWWHPYVFVMLGIAELLVPVWAARAGATSWHPGHITERYGLFTIIVLGESILSTSMGIQAAVASGEFNTSLIPIIAGGLLIIFSMWWAYFDWSMSDLLTSVQTAFAWGYGHYFIFASIAAVGAGLAVEIDYVLHHAEIDSITAGMMIAIPSAIYLLTLWALHYKRPPAFALRYYLIPIFSLLLMLMPFTPQPALLIGILLVLLLIIKLVLKHRQLA